MQHWTVTANRLDDGGVTYLRADRVWTTDLQDAWTCPDKAAAEPLLAWAGEQEHVICDPYLITVEYSAEGISPLKEREKIRAEGPDATLRRLGYDVGLANAHRQAG